MNRNAFAVRALAHIERVHRRFLARQLFSRV
jgi:hypothetical protein